MSDQELLDRLRDGDTRAFDSIFRTWYESLVRVAERMLRDRGVAEEIVQDVMLELWRRRDRLAADGSPQAYLFQSTRNRALNHLRHLRVEQMGVPQIASERTPRLVADSGLVEEEISVALRQAIEELPPRCRQVFELSRMRGLHYAEIAQTMGVSVKAVEAQMGRALKALRERLAPWLPEGRQI